MNRIHRPVFCALLLAALLPTQAAPTPLPTLDLPSYMGRWHQVALYPNRFQAQCLDSTTATYTLLADGRVRVLNRCRTQDGWDETEGIARPRSGVELRAGGVLAPAALEVSFLPAALRWLPVGWGRYDLLRLGPEQQWALVSEPTQQYLWVLARSPQLDATQWQTIENELRGMGFDLARLKRDPSPAAP
ncbi:apolipoprotein D and lipocalin family protein [Inhella inkyongensis]|uniref:Outer membrane lipoprotein Blc n=1 Tax=Inhella inkyongensis TaxID=392593 RepID=A0A840S8U5_9BURK|nr:lipocalin family protein [Inhella inkyongensis]MBB5205214.1 apolipoprotein D and lipocalin family protein [Inhella inkyongensis]